MDLISNKPVDITSEDMRVHTWLVGGSGSGKSITLGTIVLSHILDLSSGTIALVDLVGGCFNHVISTLGAINRWFEIQCRSPILAYRLKMEQIRDALFSRIYVLDFSSDLGYTFNPLELHAEYGHTGTILASDLLLTMERAFMESRGSLSGTRQLQLNLRAIFSVLAESRTGATLVDAYRMLMAHPDQIKSILRHLESKQGDHLKIDFCRFYLESYLCEVASSKSQREARDLIHSTMNMLGTSMAIDQVHDFVDGKTTLDIDGIIRNDGGAILANIPAFDVNSQRFLGALLLIKLLGAATRRDKADYKTKPITIVCDEFHNIVGDGSHFANELCQIRNVGARFVLAGQSLSQLQPKGDASLLEALEANTNLQLFYKTSNIDAQRIAPRIFKPMGTMQRLEYEEISKSLTRSSSRSFSKSVSKAISKTIARSRTQTVTLSKGLTLSVSRNAGVTVVRAVGEGWTVAQGKNWGQFSSKGVTISKGRTHSTVESQGQANGSAESVGQSVSDTESTGSSSSQGTGQSMSFSDSMSFGDLGLDSAMAASRMNRGDSESSSKGLSDARSHSVGKTIGSAISSVVNSARAVSEGESRNVAGSKSQGKSYGESVTESHSRSISKAVSLMQGITEGLARSLSVSTGQSVGLTESEGETETESQSESVQEGVSEGETFSTRKAFYDPDQEAKILAYRISSQKERELFLFNRQTGKVSHLRTLDTPIEFDNRLFGKDYTEDFLERVKPKATEPSGKDAFKRLEEKLFEATDALDGPEGF